MKYKILEQKPKECKHFWTWIFPKDSRHAEIVKEHPSLVNRGGCIVLCEKCNKVTTST